MSAKKCAPNCARARERRQRALEKSQNAQSYHRGRGWRPTMALDHDFEISDATEYQSLSGRSFSCENRPSRKYLKHVDTPAQTSDGSLGGSSMCLSSRTSSRSTAGECQIHHRIKRDVRHRASCSNEECSPRKSHISLRRRERNDSEVPHSESETQSERSQSESLLCPELCEQDLLRLPSPKTTCNSSCRKQAWLDKQREKRQAQVDKYMLNKGLNYFDDLCRCSLKCLMTQICMDPFVKKTVASAAFFFLGIKLCCELDSWYIPF